MAVALLGQRGVAPANETTRRISGPRTGGTEGKKLGGDSPR